MALRYCPNCEELSKQRYYLKDISRSILMVFELRDDI